VISSASVLGKHYCQEHQLLLCSRISIKPVVKRMLRRVQFFELLVLPEHATEYAVHANEVVYVKLATASSRRAERASVLRGFQGLGNLFIWATANLKVSESQLGVPVTVGPVGGHEWSAHGHQWGTELDSCVTVRHQFSLLMLHTLPRWLCAALLQDLATLSACCAII
jgi:hypothetical protein